METDTVVSLRQSISSNEKRFVEILHERDKLYQERDARYQERFKEVKEASHLAARQTDHRFVMTNEWRATTNDVINTRLSRDEFFQRYEHLSQKLDDATSRLLIIEGRNTGIGASISVVTSTIAILISGLTAIITYFHN